MKLTIAYLPEDADEAKIAETLSEYAGKLLEGVGRVKVRHGKNNPPFSHIYIAAKKRD